MVVNTNTHCLCLAVTAKLIATLQAAPNTANGNLSSIYATAMNTERVNF